MTFKLRLSSSAYQKFSFYLTLHRSLLNLTVLSSTEWKDVTTERAFLDIHDGIF